MPPAHDDGFATPVAAVMCLAIALVVGAGVMRGLSDLRQARAELARTQVEYALDAAHNGAVLAIATSSRPPPYHWRLASLGSAVDVIAEPERFKLSIPALAALDDTTLAALGADDPAATRARLLSQAEPADLPWLGDAAGSPAWRACAPALASKFGISTQPVGQTYGEPEAGRVTGFWRAGETWRIQITRPDGWRDERYVRFTGNGLTPAALLGRRLTRGAKGTGLCTISFEPGAPA